MCRFLCNNKYIIRLDDACPTYKKYNWDFLELVLAEYNIKPIVAVIPNNKDKSLFFDKYDPDFWERVKLWEKKGWSIALHGYNHKYITNKSGLIPLNKKSEFAGLAIKKQCVKIEKSINIFNKFDININVWVAPSHTFDNNTLLALKKRSNINIISDGIALQPYYKYGFYWIPQQIWKFHNSFSGLYTVCLHPNLLDMKGLLRIKAQIIKYKDNIISLDSIPLRKESKRIIDRIFSIFFWSSLFIKRRLNLNI